MKTHGAPFHEAVVILAALVLTGGCHGGPWPEYESADQNVGIISPEEVEPALESCSARERRLGVIIRPDALYRVEGNRDGMVVAVVDELQVCHTSVERLRQMNGHQLRLQTTSGDLPQDQASAPADDSNPLPAKPQGGESAGEAGGGEAGGGEAEDSNPLPAQPGVGGNHLYAPADDSNPLPALPDSSDSASNGEDDSGENATDFDDEKVLHVDLADTVL